MDFQKKIISYTLPTALYSAQQVRQLDASLIVGGTLGFVLMQRAAQACFETLQSNWHEYKEITVITGAGNNAGDGFLVACLAQKAGWKVQVLYLVVPKLLNGDAAAAYQQAVQQNIIIEPFVANSQLRGVVVDALLGTGCNKEVTGEFKQAIEKINASDMPVCAVDIPSGLNADTGQLWGVAVKAQLTVSFIGLKIGLFSMDGPEYSGEIVFNDLQADAAIVEQQVKSATRLELTKLATLPARALNCHKGNFGHVAIIAGDYGMAGAAILSASAALRCGAGLVSVATREKHAQQLGLIRPELMSLALEDSCQLAELANNASVVAIGPGLGQGAWAKRILNSWTANSQCLALPQLWDADALNWLAQQPDESVQQLTKQINCWILTPHPAEAARLLQTTTAKVQSNRILAAQQLAQRYQATVVLKGIGSLITSSNGEVYLCDTGHPAMAGAGMGDVLTGWIIGLIAQGMSPLAASNLAVYLHASSGKAIGALGRGMLASELIEQMRWQLQQQSPI